MSEKMKKPDAKVPEKRVVIHPVPMFPGGAPQLCFPAVLLEEVFIRASMVNIEVSGFGVVQPENGHLVVKELFRAGQMCSPGSTTINDACAHKTAIRLLEHPDCGLFWWHSHVDMGVFWSSTDDRTKGELFATWGVAMVVNRKREYKVALVNTHPVCVDTPLGIYVQPVYGQLDLARIEKELLDDVQESWGWGASMISGTYDWFEEARRREDADGGNRSDAAEGSCCDNCGDPSCGDRGRWTGISACPYLREDGFRG